MIRSFASERTLSVYLEVRTRGVSAQVAKLAKRKLDMVSFATKIDDLRNPPGNRLERLQGDRHDQWSIRVNDQWRICFRWDGRDAYDVELVDYH